MARKSSTKSYPSPASISPEQDRKWRAQSALRTLTEAEEIRGDKALMRDVKEHAKSQIKTVGNVLKKNGPRGR